MKNIVIIPTYNEKENIENIVRAVLALDKPSFEILVIDDGSPDGTADIVKRMMEGDCKGRLHLVERSGKLGLGTAYIAGFRWAIERKYDYVFEMDADFSHAPADLPRLWSACAREGYDVAVGSRYVSGVNVVNWPMGRVLMSYFASKYVRLITRVNIHDTTAGFVCYRREVLETMELDKIRFKGYAFQIEMKFTAIQCGFQVKEVPVIFVNRELGTSKMSGGIFSEALFGVMRLRWDGWFRRYPKRLMTMLITLFSLCNMNAQEVLDNISLWPDKEKEATLTVFLPQAGKANGMSIVCCPGGGYTHLAMDHEGTGWADYFNSQGFAFAVLKYRMPKGDRQIPISDALQAMSIMRANAKKWNIDPKKIGIMGSSAGGHLASTIATHSNPTEAPAFQILFYPVITMDRALTHLGSHDNLLGSNPSPELETEFSNECQVSATTPPALLLLSDDDTAVPSQNGVGYYLALRRHGIHATLHVYPTGGHGWGNRTTFAHHDDMMADLQTWLDWLKAR